MMLSNYIGLAEDIFKPEHIGSGWDDQTFANLDSLYQLYSVKISNPEEHDVGLELAPWVHFHQPTSNIFPYPIKCVHHIILEASQC